MDIYVSDARNCRKKTADAVRYGAGHMVTPPYLRKNQPVFWALDNGAFITYKKGGSFDSSAYMEALNRALDFSRLPNFTVLPDIVAGGRASLEMSMSYLDIVKGIPRYLALQDGMTVADVEPLMNDIEGLFIGGTVSWKYRTMAVWVWLAHKYNKKCHVGRIGTMEGYKHCYLQNVDSVDGSNPSRNDKMIIVKLFHDWVKERENQKKVVAPSRVGAKG